MEGHFGKIPLLNFYITNRWGLYWGCSNSLCHCLASPSESAGRMAQRHGPAFLQGRRPKLVRVQPPPLPPWLNYRTVCSIPLWSKASTGWRETSLMHTQPVLQHMDHPSSSQWLCSRGTSCVRGVPAPHKQTSADVQMMCLCLQSQVTKVCTICIHICHLYIHTHNKHVWYANSIKIHIQYSTSGMYIQI